MLSELPSQTLADALSIGGPGKEESGGLPVALVCMPWGSVGTPSLAMGLLKRCLQMAGFAPDLHFLNVRFAERLGLQLYERISQAGFSQTEWFFSQALFGPDGLAEIRNGWADLELNPAAAGLRARLKEIAGDAGELCNRIATEDVPSFIDDCMAQISWAKYAVVGFTTTFAQSLSSLLLAKRIKQEFPRVKIVFGGANVDSEMGAEYMRAFPWIDYVVHGEAEKSFPTLLDHIGSGRFGEKIPGVSLRRGGELLLGDADAKPLVDMNEAPVPDYSDYVSELERSGFRKEFSLTLFFETSRGCWWGAKHHCTFCGLNGSTMAFRRKDPARVYSEVMELSSKYRCMDLCATDNIIPHDYFTQLLPKLAALDTDISLFYEVKANLTREQIRALAESGVRRIQPGIESFNSRILQLMRKGVTAIQNIQLLKWCYEFGITPVYNVLYGFPGEVPEDYETLPGTFRLLAHLQPPTGILPVVFERFSPYFFDKEKFGLQLKPRSEYPFIFPQSRVNLDRIAYFFDGNWHGQVGDAKNYMRPARKAWLRWRKHWARQSVFCYYDKGPDYLYIHDNRPGIESLPVAVRLNRRRVLPDRGTYLKGKLSAMYLFCDESHSLRAIHEMVRKKFGEDISEAAVRAKLDRLVLEGLMFREDDRYLSLAVRKPKIRPVLFQGTH